MLVLYFFQEVDWSRYGSENHGFFAYDFKTWQVFDVHQFAVARGPRRVPELKLMFQIIRYHYFANHSSPAFRAANLTDSSSVVL